MLPLVTTPPPEAAGSGAVPLVAALALVFAALPLAQTFVVPGVSVADLALATAAGLIVLWHLGTRSRPVPPGWLAPGALFAGWAALGGLFLRGGSPLPFAPEELWKSLAKLVFYLGGAALVAIAARRAGEARWCEALLWALTVHSAIALYVYLAMQTSWGLPYRFLWAGSQAPDDTTAWVQRFSVAIVRARGVAAEPSYLGFVLALGLATVLLASRRPRARPWREAVIALALVLTFSLAAYALALAALLLVLASHRRAASRLLPRALLGILLVLLVTMAWPRARDGFQVSVIERSALVVAGAASPVELKRVVGSWGAARLMARASPLLGAGLGNYDVAIGELLPELDPRLAMEADDQGWNMLAYVLGTMGWPGLALFLLLLGWAVRAHPWGGLLLLAATFADGTLLGAPFWVFFALLARRAEAAHTRAAPAP
jgi:O-antigen ligase